MPDPHCHMKSPKRRTTAMSDHFSEIHLRLGRADGDSATEVTKGAGGRTVPPHCLQKIWPTSTGAPHCAQRLSEAIFPSSIGCLSYRTAWLLLTGRYTRRELAVWLDD